MLAEVGGLETRLLGGADGEMGGADGSRRGVFERAEDELVVARHEDDALGGRGWVEVADPLQAVGFAHEDAAEGGLLRLVEGQLAGQRGSSRSELEPLCSCIFSMRVTGRVSTSMS